MSAIQKSIFEVVNRQKTARLTNLKDKYRCGTWHCYYQAKNLSEMFGLKSATYKRVITITAIIFATVNRNYCLHEAVNVQKY